MLRVNVQALKAARKDGGVEDDFKTWVWVALVSGGGAPSKYWYTADAELNLGKTSVRCAG